jgi:two-component system chemotaxis response regulator CheY
MAKFLIVDDDPVSRMLVRHFLSPFGDCDMAYDGREALMAFRMALDDRRPYDLVCLDIMMPGTDGHAALDAIRKMEHERGILGSDGAKILMVTAIRDSKHCIRAFREGCESYITKPIRGDALVEQVRSLLGDLPLQPVQSRPEPVALTPEPEPPPPPANLARYLIVDDDGVCRELLKNILSPHGVCDLVHDGAEAIDAVRIALEDRVPYDLVCLDIMMPGVSGHEALVTIRDLEAEHGIHGSDGVKVIMTTALADSKHCIQAFREGCESYVTKPIDQSKLFKAMRQLGLFPAGAPASA